MQYIFSEVLNDVIDYFLLSDLQLLKRFKDEHQLPDDLASEFVSNESGDKAVLEGVLIPLIGVENHPYNIVFTLAGTEPAMPRYEDRIQHRRGGYSLRVEHGRIHLYTWRILQAFTEDNLNELLERYQQPNRPTIEIENGWYEVEILAGEILRDGYFEPAFEFVLTKTDLPVDASKVDVNYRFEVEWRQGTAE